MTRAQALALAVLVAGAAAQAEPQQAVRPQPAQTFRTGTEVVFVDVSVRDGGQVVAGLRAEDFELTDNGVRQRIESVEATAVPIDLTVVFDLSGNIRRQWADRPRAAQVLRAVHTQFAAMAALLRPDDRVRLLAVDEHVQLVVPFSPAAQAPAAQAPAAQALEFDGKPALYDALAAALVHQVGPARRHVVVAATKGRDSISAVDARAVGEIAARADVLFHLVLMEAAADADDESARFQCAEMGYCWPTRGFWAPYRRMLFGPRETHELTPDGLAIGAGAESTGGSLHRTMLFSEPTLFGTFKKALDDFRGGYMLRYTPQGVARTGWHDIDVRVPARRSYTVRARNGYAVEETPRAPAPKPSAPIGAAPLRRIADYVTAYGLGAYLEVAQAFRQASDLERLMRDFEALENPWPGAPRREAVFVLELTEPGAFSRDSGTHDLAIRLLERFTRLVRPPLNADVFELYWHFAVLAVLEGALRPGEAEAFVNRALERFPGEARFLLSRAIIADQRLGAPSTAAQRGPPEAEIQEVRRLYETAIRLPQVAAEARLRLAWLLHRARRHDLALTQLSALGADPLPEKSLEYLRHLVSGHVLVAMDRQDDGIRAFRAALDAWPGAQSARVALMNALVMRGDRAEAQSLALEVQTDGRGGLDPWWTYWQGQYRLLPAIMARLRELMGQ